MCDVYKYICDNCVCVFVLVCMQRLSRSKKYTHYTVCRQVTRRRSKTRREEGEGDKAVFFDVCVCVCVCTCILTINPNCSDCITTYLRSFVYVYVHVCMMPPCIHARVYLQQYQLCPETQYENKYGTRDANGETTATGAAAQTTADN